MVENERRRENDRPTGAVGLSSVESTGIGWSAQTLLADSPIGENNHGFCTL